MRLDFFRWRARVVEYMETLADCLDVDEVFEPEPDHAKTFRYAVPVAFSYFDKITIGSLRFDERAHISVSDEQLELFCIAVFVMATRFMGSGVLPMQGNITFKEVLDACKRRNHRFGFLGLKSHPKKRKRHAPWPEVHSLRVVEADVLTALDWKMRVDLPSDHLHALFKCAQLGRPSVQPFAQGIRDHATRLCELSVRCLTSGEVDPRLTAAAAILAACWVMRFNTSHAAALLVDALSSPCSASHAYECVEPPVSHSAQVVESQLLQVSVSLISSFRTLPPWDPRGNSQLTSSGYVYSRSDARVYGMRGDLPDEVEVAAPRSPETPESVALPLEDEGSTQEDQGSTQCDVGEEEAPFETVEPDQDIPAAEPSLETSPRFYGGTVRYVEMQVESPEQKERDSTADRLEVAREELVEPSEDDLLEEESIISCWAPQLWSLD